MKGNEKERRKELHFVFIDLENACNLPRKELSYCMRKSGEAKKYVKVGMNIYGDCLTTMRCAIAVTEGFSVKVGLHQESPVNLRAGGVERRIAKKKTESEQDQDGVLRF